jgi:hypothetical protein
MDAADNEYDIDGLNMWIEWKKQYIGENTQRILLGNGKIM